MHDDVMKEELEYWRKDSAAAWDKCEEYRLKIERLQAALKKAAHYLDDFNAYSEAKEIRAAGDER
jgi:hypothetical protein